MTRRRRSRAPDGGADGDDRRGTAARSDAQGDDEQERDTGTSNEYENDTTNVHIYISERLAEPTRALKRARPPSKQPELARDPPHGGLERARKTQRGRARAAQRPAMP